MKMDAICQELRQRVEFYYNRLERFFVKGKILDVKRRKWFLAKLSLELRKLLVVQAYQDMDKLLVTIIEMEKNLGEIKETRYELL
jgi:hypothetical protein